MNKLYFGFPLIVLAIFVAVFWRWDTDYERKRAEDRASAELAILEKQQKDAEEQRLAILKQNEETRRRNEELAKEREREELERTRREENIRIRDEANNELRALSARLTTVRRDIEIEETLIKNLDKEKASLQAEKDFLAGYVSLAQRNADRMKGIVEKVMKAAENTAAELARIEAAEAAKKSK